MQKQDGQVYTAISNRGGWGKDTKADLTASNRPVLLMGILRFHVWQLYPSPWYNGDRMLLYHVTPLHYLPHIIQDSALYAQSVLAVKGIAPRATARRRDRMLDLADYVHLSLRPHSPLLADKLTQGFPHALLEFDGDAVLALPETALLPYNTKAWRTKAAYVPVTDREERRHLLQRHQEEGRYPSLEALVKYGLDLSHLCRIAFLTDNERDLICGLLNALALAAPSPLVTDAALFPLRGEYRPVTRDALAFYFTRCRLAGALLPPPPLPFD